MSIIVESGITSSGCIVENDTMQVYGTALQTTVNSGGKMYVSSGGTADGTTIERYGSMHVSGGATANDTVLNTSSYINVLAGGTAENTVVNGYGSMSVKSGGSASIVFNPWQGIVHSSAGAEVTYLERDAAVYFGSAWCMTGKTDHWESGSLVSGGSAIVYAGGTAAHTAVDGGTMYVSGGTAVHTDVTSGGILHVISGGTAADASLERGSMFVFGGAAADGIAVGSGGLLYVYGTAANIDWTPCVGQVIVADDAVVTYVSSYSGVYFGSGDQLLWQADSAASQTIRTGGSMLLFGNGTAADTIVSGGSMILYSGAAASGTVVSGGSLQVSSGALATDTLLKAGCSWSGFRFAEDHLIDRIENGSARFGDHLLIAGSSAALSGSETFSGMDILGGVMTVADGGVLSSTMFRGTSATVASGGAMYDVVVSRGTLAVSGGVVDGAVFSGGYVQVEAGGVMRNADFSSQGFANTLNLEIRGTVQNLHATSRNLWSATVYSGGVLENLLGNTELVVRSGGSASIAFAPKYGRVTSETGAVVTYLERDAGIYLCDAYNFCYSKTDELRDAVITSTGGGLGPSAFVYGGASVSRVGVGGNVGMHVYEGAVVDEVQVSSGGSMFLSGGTARDALVLSRGLLHVSSGGLMTAGSVSGGSATVSSGGAVNGATVCAYGYMYILSGGAASGVTMGSGGSMFLSGGGAANGTIVTSIGSMTVSSGAVVENTVVSSGGRMFVRRGAVHAGRLELEAGCSMTVSTGAFIDFTAAAQTTSGGALINDWSLIRNGANANYTLTVAVDQASGEYALAAGAADFNKTVTVKTAEAELGTLAVGGTLVCGDTTYALNKADGLLSLTVIGPEPPAPTSTVAEVVLTITDPNHDYRGATGGWKVQGDQTVEWQDLTTLGEGYSYLGLGRFTAGKAMPDIYVYNAGASYIAAYITDDTGAITGFETAFLGSGALGQVGLADFNADGISDLLLRTADGFVGYYANGAFNEVQGLGLEWSVAALGDVDGNGRADVVIAHEAGYVGAYLIGNDGSISWADLGNLDNTTQIVGAGDVNGDGTDDVIVQVGANYYGAWLCGAGAVTGFFGIGTFDATVQDIADYNDDGTDDLLFRTAGGVVGAALITGADATAWAEYGALGDEWSTKGVGIL